VTARFSFVGDYAREDDDVNVELLVMVIGIPGLLLLLAIGVPFDILLLEVYREWVDDLLSL